MPGIREVDTVQEVIDVVPIEVVPPSMFVFVRHNGVVQDSFKEEVIPVPIATIPPFELEPTVQDVASALPHGDEEPVRGFHVRRIGRDLNAEQLVVQFDELVPDAGSPGGAFGIRIDPDKQPGKLVAGVDTPGRYLDLVRSIGGNVHGHGQHTSPAAAGKMEGALFHVVAPGTVAQGLHLVVINHRISLADR